MEPMYVWVGILGGLFVATLVINSMYSPKKG